MIKKQGIVYPYVYATHPFDAIGWDGNHYPWALSIHDFEPITGRGPSAASRSPDF
jgi:homogentisate 1,2-dioxygenase